MKRDEPKPGQECVWDYPRPPRLELCKQRVRVEFNGEVVADSGRAYRLLETSHPPTYYIPSEDVRAKFLAHNSRGSFCEFKGEARYHDIVVGSRTSRDAAWSYSSPNAPYLPIRDYLAFYPSRVDACFKLYTVPAVGGDPQEIPVRFAADSQAQDVDSAREAFSIR